ncbi:sensor domain-containing diguanylate cyclase [Psychrobacillus sp. OK032]|uniref:sensor domain-containing diguanylate cyclase n=1 Tax=Psychrobacillus sp. OK032 TaxID=1884358 RepID=UPI0008AB265B|nr:sensor domain-containing diguanylate cyclase [Psychrobacillus sp. OK032]SER85844.1 diguanylate cyclase (GGDEF) domain-containing protein [Psychrobacillus sp. OK032]
MNISDKAKKNIYILWLLVVPLGTYLAYQYAPIRQIDWGTLSLLIVLALLTTIFPFYISGTTMLLVQWVTLVIYLNYGMFAELLVMQLCLIPIAYHMKTNRENAYRIVYSSFMFFLVSIICGTVVHVLGFELGSLVVKDVLIYGSIYALLYTLFNHLFLYFREVLTGHMPKFFTKDFGWDVLGLLMTLPFGISLYFLQSYVGTIALWLLGVPFILITLLIRLYSDSEKVNSDLNKASEFGHELAERMTSKEIIDMFIERIANMFPMDAAYIVDDLYGSFEILRAIEDGENKDLHFAHEELEQSLAGIVYEKGIPTLYNKQSEWIHIRPPFLSLEMQSVMCVPVYRNKKIEGVLVLASRNKYSFEAYQLKIVHLLCSYFAVSVEKAKYVRDAVAKSERCELTKLHNYRYLDQQLESDMEKLSLGQYSTLSLIMMDIDKFKEVNDTFGHHSGNLILQEFAQIIKREIGSSGTVARYGGEEFVILLPNYTKTEALHIAEQLRRKIEQTPFIVQSDLEQSASEKIIFITASIGVSSAPEDSDEGVALLRNADRALYTGAKQAGRNRVAEYVK